MSQSTKNQNIAKSLAETRLKRQLQECRVFTVKIDDSKLTVDQCHVLKMQFVEAKWVCNEALSSPDIFKYVAGHQVTHKDKDMNDVVSPIEYLGAQQKQSVVEELLSNIKTLSSLKKKGKKIGKIRFKREVTSINLKQFGVTYRIKDRNHLSIQKVPGSIRVHGLEQIYSRRGNLKFDIANAKLINTPIGYFVAITCYSKRRKRQATGEIGIDMGISTAITLSDGRKFNASVQETEQLKRLQRKFSKQQKGSKRRYKTLCLIKKEYQHLSNKKNDIANKIVHEILKFEQIYMQDENLTGWKVRFGKTVQHSVLGRVKAKLKPHSHVLSRWSPTTKLCVECGTLHSLSLSDRRFVCDCGVDEDRDVHAAKNMIAMHKLGY